MGFTYKLLHRSTNNWIIAFYGFGQQASVFQPLADKLYDSHSFIVVDLPLQSPDGSISKKSFGEFMQTLVDKYQIKAITTIAYSMGCRFALCLPEFVPLQLEEMILIAPDGIHIRFWNRWATNTRIGHSLFRFFVKSSFAYPTLLTTLRLFRLIPKPLYLFSKWHMRDKASREQVYNAWMNMRDMLPNWDIASDTVKKYFIAISAYFGVHDKVIKQTYARKLYYKFTKVDIVLVDKRHNILDEDVMNDIATNFKY